MVKELCQMETKSKLSSAELSPAECELLFQYRTLSPADRAMLEERVAAMAAKRPDTPVPAPAMPKS